MEPLIARTPKRDRPDFGLARWRHKLHLTQFDLANRVGCSQQHVSLLEYKARFPSLRIACALAGALRKPVDAVLAFFRAVDRACLALRSNRTLRYRPLAICDPYEWNWGSRDPCYVPGAQEPEP